MIEKLKPEIDELFGAECPIYSSQALVDTVNQLVDAVNELQEMCKSCDKQIGILAEQIARLQTRAENVQEDTESGRENVQDHKIRSTNERLRKALDVANVILKNIKAFYQESYDCPNNINWHTVAQRLANEAKDALEQIESITKGGKDE